MSRSVPAVADSVPEGGRRTRQGAVLPSGSRRWKVLGVTSVAVFMFFLDTTVVNIAFPAIGETFPTTSPAGLSWIISAYAITFAALLVTAGRVADLVGRRRVFFIGLTIFTAASVLCGIAPTVPWLIVGRVLQAGGGAMLVPSALALVLPEFPISERATAIGVWSAIAAVASAIGPPAGSALVETAGWRWIFLVNAPIGLIAWIVGRRLLIESNDPTAERRLDPLGVLLIGLGMGALALAIVQGPDWGWTDARTIAGFVIAAAALPAFLGHARRHAAPVLDLTLFRARSFTVANLASLIFAAGFFASILASVLFLTLVWRYSILKAGLAMTPAPLAGAVFAAVGGRIADRRGFRVVILPGALLAAGAAVWLVTRVGVEPDFMAEWLPAGLLIGAGVGLGFATLGSAAVFSVPPERFAVGSAVLSTMRQLGAVIGVASLVAILGEPGPFEALDAFRRAWVFIGATAVLSGIVSLALGRTNGEG